MRGKRSHKGKTRCFTPREEIDRQLRLAVVDGNSDQDGDANEGGDETNNKSTPRLPKTEPSSSAPKKGQDGDEDDRHKGVSHLISTCNPNAGVSTTNAGVSRREAEIAARAAIDPIKLKSEAELASDLARLALVRKEREQAAASLAEEKKVHEARRQAAAERAQLRLQAIRQKPGKPGSKRQTAGDKISTSCSSSNRPVASTLAANDTA